MAETKSEEDKKEEEKKGGDRDNGVLEYTIDVDKNIITWEDSKYQSIWESLHRDFKNVLIHDPKWRTEFMSKCFRQISDSDFSSIKCEFVPPPDLKLPPTKDGMSYDFGNKAYNNYFANLDESNRDKLLSHDNEALGEQLAAEMAKLYGLSYKSD